MTRTIWVAAVAATAIAPIATAGAATTGVVYGGVTAQDWPVMLQVARDGRAVTRTVTGLSLTCTSGGRVATRDGYRRIVISLSGTFSSRFGPQTEDNGDGTKSELSGSVKGRISRARGTASGTWTLREVIRDAAGTVKDTCDSGKVKWTARQ